MEYKKWASRLLCGGIAFCIAFGGWSCFVSAFGIEADLFAMGICCACLSVMYSLCFGSRFWLVGLCAFGAAAGFLWQKEGMLSSLEGLLFHVTEYYDAAYGWGRVYWSGQTPIAGDVTPLLCLLAAVSLMAVLWVLCRRRRAVWAVLPALLPLCLCVVVTDTVPEEGYLFLLLFGMALLVLTQSVRRRDEAQGGKLTGILAMPAALCLGLLFLLTPRDAYAGQDYGQAALQNAVDWAWEAVQEARLPQRLAGAVAMDVTDTMALDAVGPKSDLRLPVMEVEAAESGTLYLRGRAYDVYDGTSWTASGGTWVNDGQFRMTDTPVTVTTWAAHPVLYVPYGGGSCSGIPWINGGYAANTEELTTYTLPDGQRYEDVQYDAEGDMRQYLTLPEATREQARALLEECPVPVEDAPPAIQNRAVAEAVRGFVKASARYDLDTRRMPGEAEDFAIWFLRESDTGYCVHFATAAAVLLRAAGVPARYVTGYMVTAEAGKTVTVGTDQGHAWVEYWIPGEGWQLLEATPGDTDRRQEGDTQMIPTQPHPTQTPEPTSGETAGTPTVADGQGGAGNARTPAASGLWRALAVCLTAAALVAVVIGQRLLRLWLRRRKQQTGTPNERALALWQEAVYLARLTKEPPDRELFQLAQKAKYSPHTLTEAELARFSGWLEAARARLREKPLYLRLVYRLVFAAY